MGCSFYGGGSGAGILDSLELIYICSNGQYDTQTKIPTIQSPNEKTFYLVPSGGAPGDIFYEYIYKNNNWELIGGANIDLNNFITNPEIDDIFDETNDPIVDVGQVDYMII